MNSQTKASIKADEMAQLEKRVDDDLANRSGDLSAELAKQSGFFRELWKSGLWLEDRLRERGATDTEIESVCFAHGQRCFGGGDPLVKAEAALQKWLDSNPDKPGPALADEINREILAEK